MLLAATEIVAVIGAPRQLTHRFQEVKDSAKRGLSGPLHIALAPGVVTKQRHNLPDLVKAVRIVLFTCIHHVPLMPDNEIFCLDRTQSVAEDAVDERGFVLLKDGVDAS